jgi:hypothetical protein
MTHNSSADGYENMSDSESQVSSAFETALVANDLSDTEVSESTEIERLQSNPLTLYEYVSININIEATLARDFQRHSQYYQTPGKFFLLDSENAIRRMFRLIDEFLRVCDIPTVRRVQQNCNQSLEYPRFIPSRHIMLVFRPRPFNQFEFLPVHVIQNEPTSIRCTPSVSSLDPLMFAAINPLASSQQSHHHILRSNPPFFVGHGVFQCLWCDYSFKVGVIGDGPQKLLQPDSVQLLEEIHPIAKHTAVTRLMARCDRSSQGSQELPCRSCQRRHDSHLSASAITMGDIVVDIDRTIGTSRISMGLTIDQEIERVMEISETFIMWCTYVRIKKDF